MNKSGLEKDQKFTGGRFVSCQSFCFLRHHISRYQILDNKQGWLQLSCHGFGLLLLAVVGNRTLGDINGLSQQGQFSCSRFVFQRIFALMHKGIPVVSNECRRSAKSKKIMSMWSELIHFMLIHFNFNRSIKTDSQKSECFQCNLVQKVTQRVIAEAIDLQFGSASHLCSGT